MQASAVVMGLLGIIVAGWVAGFIAQALGKGRAAQFIDLVTNLLCFITAISTIAMAIAAFKKLLGAI
jgi:hypothetical protein